MRGRHSLGLVLALPLAGCVGASDTGTTSQSIVGGVTDTGDPAVVIVDLGNGLCSGTVISPHVILTAGHCIENVHNTSIRFENTYGDGSGPTIAATEVLQHPLYNQGDDIGLIAIGTAAPVTPIPYNTAALASHVGEPVRIVGFGVTSENGSDSGIKRQGTASLFALLAENGGEVETTNQPQGTCYGDSGGPNFMTIGGHEVVAGVTTTGTDICGSGYDIGSRVDAYADWIQTFVASHDGAATCGADGQCDPSCASDPDCTAPPDAGVPAGPDAGNGNGGDGGGSDQAGDDSGNASGGCQTGGGATPTLALIFGALLLGIRRRT